MKVVEESILEERRSVLLHSVGTKLIKHLIEEFYAFHLYLKYHPKIGEV